MYVPCFFKADLVVVFLHLFQATGALQVGCGKFIMPVAAGLE